jgi:hypothetical protein
MASFLHVGRAYDGIGSVSPFYRDSQKLWFAQMQMKARGLGYGFTTLVYVAVLPNPFRVLSTEADTWPR